MVLVDDSQARGQEHLNSFEVIGPSTACFRLRVQSVNATRYSLSSQRGVAQSVPVAGAAGRLARHRGWVGPQG
jgi:hypothetical protein